MDLNIRAAVVMVVILTVLGAIISLWQGVRSIRRARRIPYYRLRRRRVSSGWQLLLAGPVLLGAAYLVGRYAEPVAYTYFPPSPTSTRTPTISQTPTISLSPTISPIPSITLTPAISDTPTITPTPFMPDVIAIQFVSTVTPNPQAVFSPIQFSSRLVNFLPADVRTVFENPVGSLYASFSYEGMTDGAQWTALWYRDGSLVYYETEPWQGGTGGYAYSQWSPPADEWLPGTYQVILFVGMEWKVLGEFRVTGEPPTPTFTRSPTVSPTISRTPLPSATPRPSDTRWPVQTIQPSPSLSPTKSRTLPPSATARPTDTRWPSQTP